MNAHGWSSGITPLILNLGTWYGGEWSASRFGSLHPHRESRYPFNMRLGGPQSPSGRIRGEKISYSYRDAKSESS